MTGGTPENRLANIKTHYDVVVVGGGIYGATVAWEAVSRGLSVLLMEKYDFSSGTSANSLKTIHGGLRCLQRLDFKGMREYIRERRHLMRIAPHLVEPMQCIIPTYAKFSKSKFFMWSGINVYDLVAFDRNKGLDSSHQIPSSKLVPKRDLKALISGLDTTGMTGGVSWYDAQVYNSERLVLAFVMSAVNAGADAYNYLYKKDYLSESGKITGVRAIDTITEKMVTVKATTVVDCTGPWSAQSDSFQSHFPNLKPKVMARAVNLVIKRKLAKCAFGVSPKDSSRLLFIAPWRGGSIVGTWYYQETCSPEDLSLKSSELTECLNQINSVFPALKLRREDITLLHQGLQPADIGDYEDEEPRLWSESKVFDSNDGTTPTGLYWIQGVKLTTARDTALNLINKLAAAHKLQVRASHSHRTALYGGSIDDLGQFSDDCKKRYESQYSDETLDRLVKNYGSNIKLVLQLCEKEPSLAELLPGYPEALKAEVKYVLENEMPYSLSDLLVRRMDLGSFEMPPQETIDYCADIMANYYDWSDSLRHENVDNLSQIYPGWCQQKQTGQEFVTHC